jgi:Protein of unknown function (DUF3460)
MAKPYVSDITTFIATLKKADPALESKQLAGRARLWDKTVNLNELSQLESNPVPSRSYVYQTKNDWAGQ